MKTIIPLYRPLSRKSRRNRKAEQRNLKRITRRQFQRIPREDIGKLWEDAENSRSPLVVDLDGDGKIETVSTDGNVHFDFDSNQKIENSGWIGKNEGFLVRDINGNGQIDNGTEMFGNHTVLQNGKNAVNGFEALKDLDSNGNGKFDAEDDAWSQVKVWRDTNTNGIVDSGELLTLEQARNRKYRSQI